MVIYWHKHDFRLADNEALNLAVSLAKSQKTIFVPILGLETDLIADPKTAYEYSVFHQFGYLSSIIPLYQNYEYFNVNPILFEDSILNVLEKISSLKKITHLVSHQEHGTDDTWIRDKSVAKFCIENGILWHEIAPSSIKRGFLDRDDRDKIFKNYVNAKVLPIPKFEVDIETLEECMLITDVFKESNLRIFTDFIQKQVEIKNEFKLAETSEKNGIETLKNFTKARSKFYRGRISSPNTAIIYGTRLSQFLAFGSLSLRFIYQYFWKEIKTTSDPKIKAGILGAMQRLHWREHFIQRLETEASMTKTSMNPDFNEISYSHDLLLFERFKTGNTGEVLVDACIRCLLQTGFINFRMRAMLVSYAVFGLDLDWREVGKFLASVFLDYEPGIHWSQIQMQSGITGINTIRVYSPHKQLLDQDSKCVFVKKWIPEIAHLEAETILNYPKISISALTHGNYPDPIVDFKQNSKLNKSKTFGTRNQSSKMVAKQVYLKHGSRKKRIKRVKAQKVVESQKSTPIL